MRHDQQAEQRPARKARRFRKVVYVPIAAGLAVGAYTVLAPHAMSDAATTHSLVVYVAELPTGEPLASLQLVDAANPSTQICVNVPSGSSLNTLVNTGTQLDEGITYEVTAYAGGNCTGVSADPINNTLDITPGDPNANVTYTPQF